MKADELRRIDAYTQAALNGLLSNPSVVRVLDLNPSDREELARMAVQIARDTRDQTDKMNPGSH